MALFASPSNWTVARWHRALQYFRFRRAVGGHANDYDTLACAIPFAGEAGLIALLARLDYQLTAIPEGAPRVELGQSYGVAEWKARHHPIWPYPRFAQPGITRLLGLPVHLSVQAAQLRVDACGAAGKAWEITKEDFRHAVQLEAEFARRGVVPLRPDE